jgi:1,2-diacylglycerol-3-alpha-glucose alpha-1,2-galactosyltransferase
MPIFILLILQQKLYDAAMKVNIISESAFTVQGHGVHTAFTETIDALKRYTDCDVAENTDRAADVVHIHTVGPYSLRKLLSAKGARVVSAHVTPASFVGSLVGAKYWYGLAAWYLRWFYNRADGVLAVSQEVVDELKAMGVKKPVYLVPNTINTDVFHTTKAIKAAAREKLGINHKAFVVVGSGQVQPRKRIDSFIQVAEALSDVQFIWVGGIPFKQLAADAGEMDRIMRDHPSNVRFTGLVQRADVVDYYRAADLFFLPSAQETFGIVVVEAAAAGLPILLRDLDQYKTTFEGGYEAGEDKTFVHIVKRFASDGVYYQRWQKATELIAKRYGAEAGVRRLLDVYREVIKRRTEGIK